MFVGVNLAPDFFSETLEVQDREGTSILRRLAKDMNNLLGNRSMFSVCARLNFSVQPIRHFLDIQGGHLSVPPKWNHYGGAQSFGQAAQSNVRKPS
jgi:hypothetical protein